MKQKLVPRTWTGSGQGQVEGTSKCRNEASGSMKCAEFFDWLKTG